MKSYADENATAQTIIEICDDDAVHDANESEDEIKTEEIWGTRKQNIYFYRNMPQWPDNSQDNAGF